MPAKVQSASAKTITVSFMVAGILTGLVVSVLMETLAALTTGKLGQIFGNDWVRHGAPVVVGIGVFAGLQISKPVVAWADEVVTEIARVVWPTRKDTMGMTVVVCIMVLLAGAYFGLLDVLSGSIVDWLLRQTFFGLFG
jgi:preprotein translocase subunit SecE